MTGSLTGEERVSLFLAKMRKSSAADFATKDYGFIAKLRTTPECPKGRFELNFCDFRNSDEVLVLHLDAVTGEYLRVFRMDKEEATIALADQRSTQEQWLKASKVADNTLQILRETPPFRDARLATYLPRNGPSSERR